MENYWEGKETLVSLIEGRMEVREMEQRQRYDKGKYFKTTKGTWIT